MSTDNTGPDSVDASGQGRVPTGQVAAFGFAIVPIAALALPLSLFLPPLYAGTLGLGVGLVGTIFMLARLWDFVTDVAMGWMIDRFPTRWGRRRHWVVISVPILALAGWRLYFPPEEVGPAYLFGWLFVLYIGFTLLLITHYAWGAELTPDPIERARVYGWREAFLVAGILCSIIGPVAAEQLFGAGTLGQVNVIGVFLLVTLPIGVAGLVTRLPDRRDARPPRQSLRRGLAALRNDRTFRAPIYLDFLTGLGQAITAAVFIFAATYVFRLEDQAALLMLAYFASGLLGVPVWLRATRRFGPRRTLGGALVWTIVFSSLYIFVPAGNFPVLAVVVALNGAALGPPLFLVRTLMAGAIDRTSTPDEAPIRSLGFSMLTMSNKMSGALAVGISFGVLALVGFDAESGEISEAARATLRLILALGASSTSALALLVLASKGLRPLS